MILDEPELHLAADILVPDLAGWRKERIGIMTDDEPFFTLPPDWACEVLSRSTAKTDRADKLPIYAREGVDHVWLIDPVVRTLEVLERDGGSWRIACVFRDDAHVRAVPFDAIELDMSVLWAGIASSG